MIDGKMSIKEYAETRGKSVQAVHQQLKRKSNADALKGHIFIYKINNKDVKHLDEEAVEILDSSSRQTPSVIIQENNDELVNQQREQIEALLVKVASQADKIAELSDWKANSAIALAEANQTKLLLEKVQENIQELTQRTAAAEFREAKEREAKELAQEQAEVRLCEKDAAERRIDELQKEINRPLTWKERFTGKRQ